MKYSYEGCNDEIIKNYKVVDQKIIINYLNATTKEIPNEKTNEIELLNKMLNQALERDNRVSISFLKHKKNQTLIWALTQLELTLLNISNVSISTLENTNLIFSILGCITFSAFATNMVDYKLIVEEINDIEKYNIYLSIKEKLENLNYFYDLLNINTLDNYSLDDIKKLNLMVQNKEKELSFKLNNKTLIKK